MNKPICDFAIAQPAYGQVRVSNALKQQGILVSPCGVHPIWLRHELETFAKRLKAPEAKSAQENLILTEAQLKALEKAKQDNEAHGGSKWSILDYLGSQTTFYVSTIKGVRRVTVAQRHL